MELGVLLVIAAGGALGSPARYAIEEAYPTRAGGFPAATFAINVAGSLALGLFGVLVIERRPPSRYLRPFVATGFLGAFTTFSTFVVEIVTLARDGHLPMAVWYAVASIVIGLVAAKSGMAMARRLGPRPGSMA